MMQDNVWNKSGPQENIIIQTACHAFITPAYLFTCFKNGNYAIKSSSEDSNQYHFSFIFSFSLHSQ